LPALARAKSKALQTTCINNLKELNLASLMYYDDNKVWVGPLDSDPNTSEGDWMWTLLTYYGNVNAARVCPSAPTNAASAGLVNPAGTANMAWWWTLSTPPYCGSYAMNKWLSPSGGMANTTADPQWLYTKDTSVQQPILTPMLMDSVWINLAPLEQDAPPRDLYNPGDASEGMPRCCIARHGSPVATGPMPHSPGQKLPSSINFGFVDGHADNVKLEQLWLLYWHLNWQLPTSGNHPP